MKVKKAVFPVAGLGSRFLPVTKANPKEMLPIVDKPLIQYAVEEAIRAGINHMIFITSSTKRAIEDHFDVNYELESRLRDQNKHELLKLVQNIAPRDINFSYIRQSQPLGLGHAVLCSEHIVGNEPFVVLLADDLIDDSKESCLATMTELFEKDGCSILAVQEVPEPEIHRYGIINPTEINSSYTKIQEIIEKPSAAQAPSNLAAVGRYIFTPNIFNYLKQTEKDKGGEIQLTNAIQSLLKNESVYAYKFSGKRYDCGSKLGYLQAMVEYGLKHKEIGDLFKEYLSSNL